MKVQLVYCGMRQNGMKTMQQYMDIETGIVLTFKSKLLRVESIGVILSANREGNTFSEYRYLRTLENGNKYYSLISEWTANHRVSLEKKKEISIMKKEHSRSIERTIELLISASKNLYSSDRSNFAMYVYNKLK